MKAKFFYHTAVILLTHLFLASCSSKEGNTSKAVDDQYELVKVDSFKVDNLTKITIQDYDPEEKIYLGYSMNEDDILEISENGKILNRAHKKGDGPGNYGNWNPVGMGFGPKGQRIVELPFSVLIYDENYELIQEYRIMSPLPIRTSAPLGKPPYYQINDTTYVLVGPTNYLSATNLIMNQEGKDTLQNFYQLNLMTGNVRSVIPYEANSIYNSTENIYPELMGKSFFIDQKKNELAVVQNLDNEILIYSLPDLSLDRTVPISYSEFKTYPPVPIGTNFSDEKANALNKLSARNQRLLNLQDNTYLLQYFTGISQAEYDNRTSEENPYFGPFDQTEQRILIFKNGKQVPIELEGIPGTMILSLPDNKILVREPENSEIEEEFTRFSIYELKTSG